jgi:hypothetical protein
MHNVPLPESQLYFQHFGNNGVPRVLAGRHDNAGAPPLNVSSMGSAAYL